MRRQDRPKIVPPPLPNRPTSDLYLENLRRSYRVKSDARRRERLHGVLFILALILALAVASLVWSVRAETGATVDGIDAALVDWARLAPRNPLRIASYRIEVARALVDGAAAHGLPVELVTAISLRESSGRQNARGRRGEVGVMQVHPDTAVRFRCRLGTTAEQVDCGCRVLARALKRCGTLRGALAVYGSSSGKCAPTPGGPVERMVNDRLALAARLKRIIEGATP